MTDHASGDVAIATRALAKHYGRVRAVDGMDLTVRRGEVYAFLGRNGAGKTTTIRRLLGLIRATSGEVEMLGARIRPGVQHPLARVGSLVVRALTFAAGVAATAAQLRYADNTQQGLAPRNAKALRRPVR